ncbi:unnamed protein product [Lampetra fluviatilis]
MTPARSQHVGLARTLAARNSKLDKAASAQPKQKNAPMIRVLTKGFAVARRFSKPRPSPVASDISNGPALVSPPLNSMEQQQQQQTVSIYAPLQRHRRCPSESKKHVSGKTTEPKTARAM